MSAVCVSFQILSMNSAWHWPTSRLAKEIEVVALITSEEHTFLSSTTVREIAALRGDISTMVPPHVEKVLKEQMENIGDLNRMDQYTSLRD